MPSGATSPVRDWGNVLPSGPRRRPSALAGAEQRVSQDAEPGVGDAMAGVFRACCPFHSLQCRGAW